MNESVISAQGLKKSYPGVVALDGADLELRTAEVLGLVGKNGAGKSTLIKILAGAERADAGELRIGGKPIPDGYGPGTAHRLGLAFVHQELANAPDLSVAENVAVGSRFPRRAKIFIAWRTLYDDVAEVLAGLDARIDPRAPVADLSSVQQRIVMIARGLYHHARVLVLDEPSAALAEEEVRHLHGVIGRLRAQGRSVIYVSHRLREVIAVTDRVVVMRDGKVTLVRATTDVDEPKLVAAITGEADTRAMAPSRGARPGTPEADTGVVLRVRGLKLPGVIEDVSFDLREGEILGIAGLVGSGRSALVRTIFGADRAAAGTIEVGGAPVRIRSPRDGVRAGIALLPEDRRHQGLLLGMSIRENITLTSLRQHRWHHLPFPQVASERRAASRMIAQLAIRCSGPEQEVRLLSGGTQQKVVVAKWLEQANRILIFDEPTQGIDVHAKEEIFGLIKEAADNKRGVIVISSEFVELVSLCTRVLVLQEGRVAGVLAGAEITESKLVRLAYGPAAA